jgi:hypothetical protein
MSAPQACQPRHSEQLNSRDISGKKLKKKPASWDAGLVLILADFRP